MDAIQEFLIKQTIKEKLYEYCRSMDRMDIPLGISVFAEDSQMDYGSHFQGTGQEFVKWAAKTHKRNYLATSHQVTNCLIKINEDALSAASETYLHTLQLTRPDKSGCSREVHVAARYLDFWVCQDGSWVIKKRRYVQDIAEIRLCENRMDSFGSKQNQSDPSYAFYELVK